MSKLVLVMLIATGLLTSVLAADQSASRRHLLEQLRTERQAAVKNPSRVEAMKPQIDLRLLRGASRNELLRSLGSPDFCDLPMDEECVKSTHLAYFYYPHEPSTAKDMGNGFSEITVTGGGGWALELNFSHNLVAEARWVKQL